jgi:hypothetical protein
MSGNKAQKKKSIWSGAGGRARRDGAYLDIGSTMSVLYDVIVCECCTTGHPSVTVVYVPTEDFNIEAGRVATGYRMWRGQLHPVDTQTPQQWFDTSFHQDCMVSLLNAADTHKGHMYVCGVDMTPYEVKALAEALGPNPCKP